MHYFCVIDDGGEVLRRGTLEHSEQDLAALFVDLAQLASPVLLPVTIERGEGLVVG